LEENKKYNLWAGLEPTPLACTRYAMGQIGRGVVTYTTVRYTIQHRINIEYKLKFTIEYFAEL